jgi:hypothetical protein
MHHSRRCLWAAKIHLSVRRGVKIMRPNARMLRFEECFHGKKYVLVCKSFCHMIYFFSLTVGFSFRTEDFYKIANWQ